MEVGGEPTLTLLLAGLPRGVDVDSTSTWAPCSVGTPVSTLHTARSVRTAVLRHIGLLLVAGGELPPALPSAPVFNSGSRIAKGWAIRTCYSC